MITAKDIQEAEKVIDAMGEEVGNAEMKALYIIAARREMDALTAQRDGLLEDLKYCAQWLKQREGFVPEFLAKAIQEGSIDGQGQKGDKGV